MNYEIIKELEKEQLKDNAPAFNVGDTVRVHNRIKEGNRERVQIFEGTVLKIQGGGPRTTFTVRKESSGIGVEKTWPLHSPNVEKVDVVRRGKVRRAKLTYLRNLSGKKAKVKALKDDPQRRLKLLRFALGRGYSYEEVDAALVRIAINNDILT